jgi:Xaa-Pro aminopeptidase
MLKQKVSAKCTVRRTQLMKQDSNACFIFFGAIELIRNDDSHYPFRQNSTFHYLTEFDEPNAALVLVNGESHLFVEEREESREIWDGERYGVDRAALVFGTDYSHSINDFDKKLPDLLKGSSKVYYRLRDLSRLDHSVLDLKVIKLVNQATSFRGKGSLGILPILDPTPLVAELRIVKDSEEIELIRQACSVSARAHAHLLKFTQPGMLEMELATELQYFMRKNGLQEWGYTPIVAGGVNATTLHYVRNNEILKDGDLVLVDAGSENGLFTADITQTFPVGKKFSTNQRKVYEIVLGVNREITKLAKPGMSYRALHQEACNMLSEGLKSLGIVPFLKKNLIVNIFRMDSVIISVSMCMMWESIKKKGKIFSCSQE